MAVFVCVQEVGQSKLHTIKYAAIMNEATTSVNLFCWVVSCVSRHIFDGSQWRPMRSMVCIRASYETPCTCIVNDLQP